MMRRNGRRLKLPASGFIAAALVFVLTGCSAHSAPDTPIPVTHLELSAVVGQDGQITVPDQNRTVTLQGANSYLRIDLGIFTGVDWGQASSGGSGSSAVLKDDGAFEHSAPEPCATVTTACRTTWSEQYQATGSGTTTLTWTLFASSAGSSAGSSAVPPNAPWCPAGAAAPLPPADNGCILGHITVTVIVS